MNFQQIIYYHYIVTAPRSPVVLQTGLLPFLKIKANYIFL